MGRYARELSVATLEAYGRDLAGFTRFALTRSVSTVEAVRTIDVLEYLAHLTEQRLSARSQARKLIARALEAIPHERRGVFVMHDIDGTPIPEVAETFGIPLNTAYSRLRLARRDFESAWDDSAAPGSNIGGRYLPC